MIISQLLNDSFSLPWHSSGLGLDEESLETTVHNDLVCHCFNLLALELAWLQLFSGLLSDVDSSRSSTRLHVISYGHIIGADIKLPLAQPY